MAGGEREPLRKLQDHYFKQAKAEGYRARSVFKLEELDQKNHLFHRGMKVLDLGCYPGSWMQFAGKKVGAQGLVVGVDIQELNLSLAANMAFIHQDIFKLDLATLAQYALRWDLVLSDMAPSTTGNRVADSERSFALCSLALDTAQLYLKKNGRCLVKSLQGVAQERLLKRMREEYTKVKNLRPQSTRKESKEVFVLGIGKKGEEQHDNDIIGTL